MLLAADTFIVSIAALLWLAQRSCYGRFVVLTNQLEWIVILLKKTIWHTINPITHLNRHFSTHLFLCWEQSQVEIIAISKFSIRFKWVEREKKMRLSEISTKDQNDITCEYFTAMIR